MTGAATTEELKRKKREVKRLTLDVTVEVYNDLMEMVNRKGISLTEGVRRAIVVSRYIEEEIEKGGKLVVEEADGGRREIFLV